VTNAQTDQRTSRHTYTNSPHQHCVRQWGLLITTGDDHSQMGVVNFFRCSCHVARLPDNIPAHQAMLRQVELSVGRPPDPTWKRPPGHHVPNGPTNSAAITTMFPLRLCEGKLLVAVTRERCYGPSRLRVNDDDVVQPVKDVKFTVGCSRSSPFFSSFNETTQKERTKVAPRTLTGAPVGSHSVAERTAASVRAVDIGAQSVTQATDAAISQRRTFVNICTPRQFLTTGVLHKRLQRQRHIRGNTRKI